LEGVIATVYALVPSIGRWLGGAAIKTGTQAVARGGQYSVYQGINAAEEVGYIGITSRIPTIRFTEHAASNTARSTLQYRVIQGAEGLSKTQARILEQNLINQHGLGNLLNLRNSIDPKYWWLYGIKP
jgi:predicted GIY-YIG superfamily endonuclease